MCPTRMNRFVYQEFVVPSSGGSRGGRDLCVITDPDGRASSCGIPSATESVVAERAA